MLILLSKGTTIAFQTASASASSCGGVPWIVQSGDIAVWCAQSRCHWQALLKIGHSHPASSDSTITQPGHVIVHTHSREAFAQRGRRGRESSTGGYSWRLFCIEVSDVRSYTVLRAITIISAVRGAFTRSILSYNSEYLLQHGSMRRLRSPIP